MVMIKPAVMKIMTMVAVIRLILQMVVALRRSLDGVTRPFYVPGSQLLFKPDIWVSVIAWTPFLCSGAQSVLHQVYFS